MTRDHAMTDGDYTPHGFEIRTDTESEKMSVQIRLRDSGHEWHCLSSIETMFLVEQLEAARQQLRRAGSERRMTPAMRARYRELLMAHTQTFLTQSDLAELRELQQAARGAGIDTLDELAAAFDPRTAPESPVSHEETHSDC